MAGAAISALDLQEHEGSHPRLGVVDHISCHPLGSANLSMAAETARSVGECKALIHAYLPAVRWRLRLLGSASLSATTEMTGAVGECQCRGSWCCGWCTAKLLGICNI